ncbi:L,D-transpeptidase family protein [Ancylobacter terrae]|uniref:L,D-transpeptidase family protein n=1 Tax=Ancylobacter sp. sgz301288 TaxID=3342077 RepID=UPI003859E5EE
MRRLGSEPAGDIPAQRIVRTAPGRGLAARLRALLLVGVGTLALAACTGGGGKMSPTAKAMKPLSPETVALINDKGMSKDSPIVVRIFKEESELEVWKQTRSGDYALLKTYPICRWSGELGPKVKIGDRQAPEGFYTITPGQMNPNSSYYLSFNMGFPNAYDKAWGRTGEHLMVHGDCSSAGCYAMTDEQIQEIFALGRDSFQGGQRSFQVQAYPFRMTAQNMARHRSNPNMAFWKMLKEGSDAFEVAKAPPKVDVCEKRYVFNATPADPTKRFDPSGPCPAYSVPDDISQAVAARKAKDEANAKQLASSTPAAPVRTGADGGMNKVFLAKLENPNLKAPGSLPAVVKPPGVNYGVDTSAPADLAVIEAAKAATTPSAAASVALANAPSAAGTALAVAPTPLPRPSDAPGGTRSAEPGPITPGGGTPVAQVAAVSSTPSGASEGGFMSGISRLFGGGSSEPPTGSIATPAAADSGTSGFSLSRLLGRDKPAEAPAADAAPVADVPVPQARPRVPAPGEAAARPAPATAAVSPAPARPAAAAPKPAATAAAPKPATPKPAAGQQAATEPLAGTPTVQGGTPILSTGGFSGTVQ